MSLVCIVQNIGVHRHIVPDSWEAATDQVKMAFSDWLCFVVRSSSH